MPYLKSSDLREAIKKGIEQYYKEYLWLGKPTHDALAQKLLQAIEPYAAVDNDMERKVLKKLLLDAYLKLVKLESQNLKFILAKVIAKEFDIQLSNMKQMMIGGGVQLKIVKVVDTVDKEAIINSLSKHLEKDGDMKEVFATDLQKIIEDEKNAKIVEKGQIKNILDIIPSVLIQIISDYVYSYKKDKPDGNTAVDESKKTPALRTTFTP